MSYRVDVKKKKGERFETLLRRFNTRVIRSGKIMEARDMRFFEKPDTKRITKKRALRRIVNREKRNWLEKTGMLPDEPRKNNRGRR